MSILLQINNLTKSYDIEPLFKDLTLSISSNQHIGVVGRNGAGKSTLFNIIMGLESADTGEVNVHKDTTIGYIRQQDNPFDLSETVMGFLMRSSGKEEWTCAKLAGQFQIKKEQLHREIGSFAGGYQMRIKIISMLLKEPNLLLLDEPTNYLDLSTLLLLEQFLQNFSGSFLVISHDREFLKRTCKQTLEIAHKKAFYYPQPLEEYLKHRAEQDEFARRYNKKISKQQRHLQSFVDRFRYKASKASQAQSKMKQIEKLQTITINNPANTAVIHIPQIIDKKGVALSVDNLSIGYTDTTVAKNITFQIDRGEHIAIVGNNGQGKTTLLKTIADILPSLSGSFKWGMKIRIGYYAQHVPNMLNPKDQIQTHLEYTAGAGVSDQEIYQMAGNFLFSQDDLKKPISVLSGGEKARLCLAGLLLQKNHVLLLDEPTNHLDFETVEALAEGLSESNTTMLFVSHNRTFVNNIATSIIEVNDGKVYRSHHDYENYVYHLKEKLHVEDMLDKNTSIPTNEKKERRIETRKKLKEAKKALHKVEVKTMELEKHKQELMDWFSAHTNTFSRIKQEDLAAVNHDLHEVEKEWIKAEEAVGVLEKNLQQLL
ncbi:MAG: ABC-F family ATP-binding cassette domain-containing protein [Candidatus Magasanikbacteria bacterium]|jgi:ATP-binding cassette, subfamily F, member 3|nr:ABC-F family ATP-binding cassette domain-containing protein [Candidatus Magasanikbacteria bacterium]MBT4221118.1 ABC-F family ATP-binding cassette domain-containing protein [Candidatus Magasanikbacteria bacterium]MBT4350312.1 ABC-F family ATP-binding cassette domain-containing protein [Candidatus Magasanikbacteria bacterium]MBT4541738.1 ABC-F family ATP-binding cassette domain-containing protein [Candidatus Magasanikbacteria bacterium]MBT6253285.1 ABC-F family ATP-binding cassette domain-con